MKIIHTEVCYLSISQQKSKLKNEINFFLSEMDAGIRKFYLHMTLQSLMLVRAVSRQVPV